MFQCGASFGDHLCYFCLVFVMRVQESVYCCCVVTTWERADLLTLVCDIELWFVIFPCVILGLVWYLIESIPDICPLSYFDNKNKFASI